MLTAMLQHFYRQSWKLRATTFVCVGMVHGIPARVEAQSLTPYYYEIGEIDVADVFVDPVNGQDSQSGDSRSNALRTVQEAWRRIPAEQTLAKGYRIYLTPGTYGDDPNELPNYWELRRGTRQAPIILRALEGHGTVTLVGDINMAHVSYFYLMNISIVRGGDVFHCEACDHILLRGNSLVGAPMGRDGGPAAHETVKINQSRYIYVENNIIRGAQDNAIDWVSVQYGHIVGNKISDSQSWCTYVKGGSSYVRIEANEFFDCFEGGVTAGQGTGFEFMTAPWLRYEAYDVKIINNVVHDVVGAAFGVNGGYNVLIAHNTAYRTGARSHLIEVVYGSRSCDGNSAACAARVAAGGWGPSSVTQEAQPIGNSHIKIMNNLLYNPADHPRNDQHFTIFGPQFPSTGGIPSPQRSDANLEIRGNLIWNGPVTQSLGVEGGEQGCQPDNTTCNAAQLRSENSINVVEPQLRDPERRDFRPVEGSAILGLRPVTLSSFSARAADEPSPEGELDNFFVRDFSGTTATALLIGAFSGADVSTTPPPNNSGNPDGDDVFTPREPQAPQVSKVRLIVRRMGGKLFVFIRVSASDDGRITRIVATLKDGRRIRLRRIRGEYSGSARVRSRRGIAVTENVTDNDGLSARASSSL